MRRRWHVPDGFWVALGLVWLFGWLPIALAVPGVIHGKDHVVSPVLFEAWFGVPAAVALVIFAPHAVRWLWANRPRREWVSGDDLRNVERAEPHDH